MRNIHWENLTGGEMGAENAYLFAPFYTKNDQFTKTGSGRTRGNTQKRDAFLAGNGISAGRYGTAPDITSCNDTGTILFSNLTARNIDVGDAVFSAYNVVGCEFVPSLS